MWDLVRESGTLDLNSAYCYILLCTFYTDTCVVAERAGALVGFASAFRPPAHADTLFVWQVAVAPCLRRSGLASAMLRHLVGRPALTGVRFLEATVTPSNRPSWALFESLAADWTAELRRGAVLGAELFPGGGHEPEVLLRIGPLPRGRS